MDPINSLGRMIELLRRRVSSTVPADATRKSSRDARPGADAEARPSLESLKTLIARRIRAIDPNDRQHDSKATRVFVESVITWEFGDAVLSDPKYQELIEHIDQQLHTDKVTGARFADMLRQLGTSRQI